MVVHCLLGMDRHRDAPGEGDDGEGHRDGSDDHEDEGDELDGGEADLRGRGCLEGRLASDGGAAARADGFPIHDFMAALLAEWHT